MTLLNPASTRFAIPPTGYKVLPEDCCKTGPCNFNTEMFVKSWQPMSNSWSTSSQPNYVHALGRRKTARKRRAKIWYTELLKSWPTIGQFLANSPRRGTLQGLTCNSRLATPESLGPSVPESVPEKRGVRQEPKRA